ncbi:MAG TPA: SAM-dependent methyltransferase, partial [Roseiflexaceae bacterium]|nr:SAM-dependent methyltransferase [Roseiflexaceae bacterium]
EEWYRRPNIARIYDYWLDGTQHFPVDREVADRMNVTHPNIRPGVMSNRLFLRRAVAFLAEQGIAQFVDLGTGLPTGGNVHTIALPIIPKAKVAYIDNDPLVVRLSQMLLKEEHVEKQAVTVLGDASDPEAIFADPVIANLFDFEQPIAILCFGLLYFFPEAQDVTRIIQAIYNRMAPASYLAFSHLDFEALSDDSAEEARRIYEGSVTRIQPRTIAELTTLFKDFEMVDPGIVYISSWRPKPAIEDDPFKQHPEQSSVVGGIARKP